MTSAEYMQNRVESQIDWYETKSAYNKKSLFTFQVSALAAASLIPLISLFPAEDWPRYTVALLGAVAAIATGLCAQFQFRELWIDYRTTAEALKKEKYLFQTASGVYAESHQFQHFVERVESILNSEKFAWQQRLNNEKVSEQSVENKHTHAFANVEKTP